MVEDSGGNLFYVVSPNANTSTLYRLDTAGVTTQVLGLFPAASITIDSADYIYYELFPHAFRRSPGGVVHRVLGQQINTGSDGVPALQTIIDGSSSFAFDPLGNLYYTLSTQIAYPFVISGNRVNRVASPLPGYTTSDIEVASEDGMELYHFSPTGRHLETRHALTGTVLHTFEYDSAGRFISETDVYGNVTLVERDIDGKPTAIVAPYGQRTELMTNSDGFITSVANPLNHSVTMTYEDERLKTFTNGRGNTWTYTYDANGRLISDVDPTTAEQTLSSQRLAMDTTRVTHTTAEGRVATYSFSEQPNATHFRTIVDKAGRTTTSTEGQDGKGVILAPDGVETTSQMKPDPRFAMQSPLEDRTQEMPSGLTRTVNMGTTVTLANPADLTSIVTMTKTTNVSGDTTTSVYDGATRTWTTTSPEGRISTMTTDANGRVVQSQMGDLASVTFAYDSRGELISVTQGTGPDARTTTMVPNTAGFIESITDAENRTSTFAYDNAGRTTQQTRPDSEEILQSYDENDNISSITPPGKPAHEFAYTAIDLEETYLPPNVGFTPKDSVSVYNDDRQLTQTIRPDGRTVTYGYDTAGRLSTTPFSRGTQTNAYHPTTGKLTSITTPEANVLAFGYDGSLLTGQTWSGEVNGSVSFSYDNRFRMASRSVNGTNTVAFGYDGDGLLTQVGAMSITRDPLNGLVTGTVLGNVTDSFGYNTFGEVTSYNAQYLSNQLFSQTFERDKLGRITHKVETVLGVTTTFDYRYDLAGRLDQVKTNGAVSSEYTYDANGNRLSKWTPADGFIFGTYDAQDRLLTYGDFAYTYRNSGELETKTHVPSADTTMYLYDEMGNLLEVVLPDGADITYIIDGRNRRIGKRVDGVLTQAFLYESQLRIAAELDGGGTLNALFVYSSSPNSPEYVVKAGNTYRITSDHVGSPRLMVDATTGTVAAQLDYDEFGAVTLDSQAGFQPFGFAGGVNDDDTSLVRFGARDYDVSTGRWVQRDPDRYWLVRLQSLRVRFERSRKPRGSLWFVRGHPAGRRPGVAPRQKQEPSGTLPAEAAGRRHVSRRRAAAEHVNASRRHGLARPGHRQRFPSQREF